MLNDLLCVNPKPLEVKWYRDNGKYPDRITKDSSGDEYVISDYSTFANNGRLEHIEPDMAFAIRNIDILNT